MIVHLSFTQTVRRSVNTNMLNMITRLKPQAPLSHVRGVDPN